MLNKRIGAAFTGMLFGLGVVSVPVSAKAIEYTAEELAAFAASQPTVPCPEFPVAAVVLAFALAASLFILRRRRK